MATKQLRALVGARVSHVQGPQKVSHIAQLETTTKWAESKGYKIVGQFEDLGVSAEKRPEDRPDLGQWLTDERSHEWDVIVWSKMDRAFRSTAHCVDFARWAEDRHKIVAFAEDGLELNYRPGAAKGIDAMMSELFVYLGSFFAQLELNRFKTRALDGHRTLRQTDRWASGVPPLGFKTVAHPSGKGRGLDTDPEGKRLLEQMAEKLLAGWSFIRIAAWLNKSGTRTNMDKARIAKGKDPYVNPWNVGTVIEALTSPRTQGLKMHKRETVLDGDGNPIVMAPPTFDAGMWKQIQDAVAVRQINRREPTTSTNPMLGIGLCGCTGCPACDGKQTNGICGASLAQQTSRNKTKSGKVNVHRYYRCGRTPLNCNGITIQADFGDELLSERFLEQWGDSSVTRRTFVPGEDYSHELDQVNDTIRRLRREQDAGLIVSDDDEREYHERMRALIARRTELEAKPAVSAGWVTETTDETYRQVWEQSDHRALLIERGVRFVLTQGKPLHFHLYVPEDGVPIDLSAG